MAVIDMSRMSIIAHASAKAKILRQLVRLGMVETIRSEEVDGATFRENVARKNELNEKVNRLNFVFTFFKERNLYAQKKGIQTDKNLDLKRINELINLEEFEMTSQSEYDTMEKVAEIEELNSRLIEINSKTVRLKGLREQLSFYQSLDIKFSEIKDTENTLIKVGSVPKSEVIHLSESLKDLGEYSIVEIDNKLSLLQGIFLKECKEEVISALTKADFTSCPFNYDVLASDEILKIDDLLKEQEEEVLSITQKAISMFDTVNSFKVLYDYYHISLKKIEVMANSSRSSSAFLLEGWVPKPKIDFIRESLESSAKNIDIYFRDPLENEVPPVYTKNNAVVTPFEGITNMYGVPNPKARDSDPSLFVAIFYFMFFGIMISDAGYGLLIALLCFGYHYIKKPKKGSGNMILMFGMCGVSTLIWGTLFGGWFGIETEVLKGSVFGRALLSLSWFNPIEEPLIMFGLSLALGIIQISVGFAINASNKWKKDKLNAIFNDLSWVTILMGVAVIAAGMLLGIDYAGTVGGGLSLTGLLMLVIGGTLNKKGIVKKVAGSFGNLYGGVNVFSDILSYSRLFGLGLATGVIGLVVNQLATIVVGFIGANVIGYVFAFGVVVFGHTFNLGINFLGAYVHNSRLQYIEFFSKFYEGSGKAFKPLGSDTKYIFLDN